VSNADALLRGGDLAGARAALVEIVRAHPSDEQARMFLFQLLAVAGEWSKARTQLQSLAQLSAAAQMLAVAYGQLLDAEAVRQSVFAGDVRIDVLANPDGWAKGLADAIQFFATGEIESGAAARDAAFDAAPDCTGTFNSQAFEWISDADSRFGPSFEIVIAGRYGLMPFDAIEQIRSAGPRDLRDLVWLPIELGMKSGQSIAAFLPVRYPGIETSGDANIQLARATTWSSAPWGDQGAGQRLWTLSGNEDVELLSLKTLVVA
jgi:type VI secretion system protein ImpE